MCQSIDFYSSHPRILSSIYEHIESSCILFHRPILTTHIFPALCIVRILTDCTCARVAPCLHTNISHHSGHSNIKLPISFLLIHLLQCEHWRREPYFSGAPRKNKKLKFVKKIIKLTIWKPLKRSGNTKLIRIYPRDTNFNWRNTRIAKYPLNSEFLSLVFDWIYDD